VRSRLTTDSATRAMSGTDNTQFKTMSVRLSSETRLPCGRLNGPERLINDWAVLVLLASRQPSLSSRGSPILPSRFHCDLDLSNPKRSCWKWNFFRIWHRQQSCSSSSPAFSFSCENGLVVGGYHCHQVQKACLSSEMYWISPKVRAGTLSPNGQR
jgi:hypothetical protein